jgi:hypothetical protein
VRITWDPVPGASRYEVHRATSRDGTYELIGETTTTTYDDTAVTVGTTYWYKVRAWNALGYGPFSDPDSGYASAAGGGGGGGGTQLPGQVRGVSASDGTYPDKIRITWNSVSGAKTYRVYRSPTGVEGTFSQIAEVPSGTTSYDDTTVTDLCQEYWYAVSAWNDAGEGPLSVPDSGYLGGTLEQVKTDKIKVTVTPSGTDATESHGKARMGRGKGCHEVRGLLRDLASRSRRGVHENRHYKRHQLRGHRGDWENLLLQNPGLQHLFLHPLRSLLRRGHRGGGL